MRVQVVQIPPQTTENILAWLKKYVEFTSAFLANPVDIPLHVPLCVPSGNDRDLGLQKLWQSFFPLMRARRVPEARMEKHKAVQIGIKRLEILRFVHGVEVVNVRCDLQLTTESILHNASKRILRGPLGKWELVVTVGHTLRSNENQVYQGPRENVAQLQPDVTGKGRFRTRTEDEYSNWGCFQAQTLDIDTLSSLWRVQRVSKSWKEDWSATWTIYR